MNNRQLARIFNMLSKIMELHGENPFKTRSYSSAYNTIRRHTETIIELPREELLLIKGIGKNIADKIVELGETGSLSALQKYIEVTPAGIVEMLNIKGLGAKKILTIWKDLEIESPGELLYACKENRLIELKGFGEKTQKNLMEVLQYYLDGKGKYLYGHIINEANELLGLLQENFPNTRIELSGEIKRKMPEINGIEYLTDGDTVVLEEYINSLSDSELIEDQIHYKGSQVSLMGSSSEEFDDQAWKVNASPSFLEEWEKQFPTVTTDQDEAAVFSSAGIAYIPSEARESGEIIQLAKSGNLSIIEEKDIKGVIHTHTTYSDGSHSVREMAEACIQKGYEYLVVSDHSQVAVYANGLKPDRVLQQMEEIDDLNKTFSNFKIYKSIECDILSDGRLDYEDDFLEKFDLVISSVHSVLKMTEEKATARLEKAIAHPATRILGHMTGRLLLSRPGYPVDYKYIIDACAKHNVVIELNANPYRLDMDWRWIPYAIKKGVMIAINPDAHSIAGIDDIAYGVAAARKSGMSSHHCLNSLTPDAFEQWIKGGN